MGDSHRIQRRWAIAISAVVAVGATVLSFPKEPTPEYLMESWTEPAPGIAYLPSVLVRYHDYHWDTIITLSTNASRNFIDFLKSDSTYLYGPEPFAEANGQFMVGKYQFYRYQDGITDHRHLNGKIWDAPWIKVGREIARTNANDNPGEFWTFALEAGLTSKEEALETIGSK